VTSILTLSLYIFSSEPLFTLSHRMTEAKHLKSTSRHETRDWTANTQQLQLRPTRMSYGDSFNKRRSSFQKTDLTETA
jgi:hypothetical protein